MDHKHTALSTWCPKAFALIGRLPGTLEDRSITIPLHRRTAKQQIQPLDETVLAAEAEWICSGLLRWAHDHGGNLPLRPSVPEALHDRAADNWRALLAIADHAGGDCLTGRDGRHSC